jgi:hypothetical protein
VNLSMLRVREGGARDCAHKPVWHEFRYSGIGLSGERRWMRRTKGHPTPCIENCDTLRKLFRNKAVEAYGLSVPSAPRGVRSLPGSIERRRIGDDTPSERKFFSDLHCDSLRPCLNCRCRERDA